LPSIVDDDYKDVEPGTAGELILRSPLVTNGYFNNPKATREAFHDGWFCTGDIGVMREGKFYVVDRKKVTEHSFASYLKSLADTSRNC
jgi:4-coumarate--CoA ligase